MKQCIKQDMFEMNLSIVAKDLRLLEDADITARCGSSIEMRQGHNSSSW